MSDQLSNFEIEDDIPQMSKLFDSNCNTLTFNTMKINVDKSCLDSRHIKSNIIKAKRGFNEKSTRAVSIIINNDNDKTGDISCLKGKRSIQSN